MFVRVVMYDRQVARYEKTYSIPTTDVLAARYEAERLAMGEDLSKTEGWSRHYDDQASAQYVESVEVVE